MTQKTEQMIQKLLTGLFYTMLTVMGWLITDRISEVSNTLKDIREDVYSLNSKSLLQEDRTDWIEKEVLKTNKRIDVLQSDFKNLRSNGGN